MECKILKNFEKQKKVGPCIITETFRLYYGWRDMISSVMWVSFDKGCSVIFDYTNNFCFVSALSQWYADKALWLHVKIAKVQAPQPSCSSCNHALLLNSVQQQKFAALLRQLQQLQSYFVVAHCTVVGICCFAEAAAGAAVILCCCTFYNSRNLQLS